MENCGYQFLKFQKSAFLAFNTSWSVFKSLGKGLECFIDKFKARKAAFGVRSIREFWKISGRSLYYEPLSWFMINTMQCGIINAVIHNHIIKATQVRILFIVLVIEVYVRLKQ